jgi:uncharacterized phage protein (TIGR01671 family)
MRQIKFRAWTGATMEYNVMVGKFGAFYVNPEAKGDGLSTRDTACLSEGNTIYSKETPIMQFTGLLDKNGKEIYEGDIVECVAEKEHSEMSGKHSIHFAESEWKTVGKDCHVEYALGTNWGGWGTFEVIGNIYENSELLK